MNEVPPIAGGGRQLIAVLIGAGISALLFSVAMMLPLVGFIAGFVAAAPLSLVRLQAGRTAALAASLLGGLIIAVAYSPLVAAWYTAQCGLTGFMVSDLAMRSFNQFRTVLWSTAAAVTLTVLMIGAITLTSGFNPQLFVQKEISQGLEQAMKLYETSGNLTEQDIEALKSGLDTIGQLMSRIYPALATLNLALIGIITAGIFFAAAAKRSVPLNSTPFAEFRTPDLLVWPTIAAGFAMLAPSQMITTPALNLLVILGAIYFVQGLAVIFCIINRTEYKAMLKAFAIILLVTQPYLAMIIAMIGIFDIWGDFRAPRKPTEGNL